MGVYHKIGEKSRLVNLSPIVYTLPSKGYFNPAAKCGNIFRVIKYDWRYGLWKKKTGSH
jgi:hypothetical protein